MDDAKIVSLITEGLGQVAPDRTFENLSLDASIASLGLDSITTMELVTHIEETIETTFPDEELPKVNSLGDLAKLIRGQQV